MKIQNIKEFKKGWFIGDFEPSLLKTKEFEVSVQFHPKGFVGEKHLHKKTTEYNLILDGSVKIGGFILIAGQIFTFEPNEISESEFLEDTRILVVRTPSIPTDKYIVS